MKSNKNLLAQLESLPYFSKDMVCQLGSQLGLADSSVDTYIGRFLRRKELLPLKNGQYVSTGFYAEHKGSRAYQFYLANIIRTPSYVSSWTALQYYNLTTEGIYAVTSVTPKVTRDYQTKAGTFAYQSIQKSLFSDFSLVPGTFDFFIASPAKALFDLLYFRTGQFRGFRLEDLSPLLAELRVDIEEMEADERGKFDRLIKEYLRHE